MLKTFIIENTWLTFTQHWFGNGYVVLPEWHKYNGTHYYDIPVKVHGGLTFGKKVKDIKWETFAPFIKDLNPEDYIVGFDTAHYYDNLDNWSEREVAQEVRKLSAQLSQF